MLRGHDADAGAIVTAIEQQVSREKGRSEGSRRKFENCRARSQPAAGHLDAMIHDQPEGSLLGLALTIGQSFFSMQVFFVYGLVLAQILPGEKRARIYLHPAVGAQ
jgi:hypothetical protein